jgi:putative NAD(P)-binding protein
VICDLEQANVEEVAAAIEGADTDIFGAGAGPGSGSARKVTMDRDGAIKLLRAAASSRIRRYVMVRGAGVEDPPSGNEVFGVGREEPGITKKGSSTPFAPSLSLFPYLASAGGQYRPAKVRVAGSNPVFRSRKSWSPR